MVLLIPRRGRDDQGGAVALLVALMAIILFTVCGFVIDLGQARVVRRHAQNAADAAALAAGNALYLKGVETPDIANAVLAAKQYALKNYGITDTDWATCHDPTPLAYLPDASTSCISFDNATKPLDVRVIMPTEKVQTPFASMVGVHSVDIAARAVTALQPGGKADCGLCIVGESLHDVQNGDVSISGGNVDLNGDVWVRQNGMVASSGKIMVEGTASGPVDGYSPAPLQHQLPIQDPLATIPLPDYSALTVKSDPCGTGDAHGPGVYGSYAMTTGSCTLQPGLYVVTGDWSFTGSAALTANGVTMYFVCGTTSAPRACNAPGEDGGWLEAHGTGTITITAPTSDPNKNLAIVYDRLNTSKLWLTGGADSQYTGTIYAIASQLLYDGNSCTKTNQSLIAVHDLAFNGNNACLKSDYQQNVNVFVPPSQLHLSQ